MSRALRRRRGVTALLGLAPGATRLPLRRDAGAFEEPPMPTSLRDRGRQLVG
jgi:hypothetical protein